MVVQGALTAANLVETARNCRHWRALFPTAQIILALSTTDVLDASPGCGVINAARLAEPHRYDGLLATALRIIVENCDLLALSPGDLPLPRFKDDSPPNHVNLQLAAAKTGLALASGRYVLRLRSDLVFTTRAFLEMHWRDAASPRGDAAVFGERVLISWLFTLNPFTVERLPLHFSDWFHFGRLPDVRRLWTAAPMSLADATYHRTHPHAAHSNARERQFYSRIGIEQHLLLACFQPVFPGLTVSQLSDARSVDLTLDILLDNFTLCDLASADCVFDKYDQDMHDPARREHCIPREAWLAMVGSRDHDPRGVLVNLGGLV